MSDYVPSSSASSSRSWKYEVFLSFRGKDTRRGFVSHLYKALEQKGIHVFKDDVRLEPGKPIPYELLKAIKESRFAVVVFSKSYASSKWCLEELAHIIKCKNDLDLNVIPVFYDVNPTDVRHQNPPFAKSFSKHEKKCKLDTKKVQRWRDAFAEAGNCSGYHLENFKDEAECIQKLVDHIFPKSPQVSSPFPESLVGIAQVEEVISLLDPKSDDVQFFGLHGMGGIGKTEIANAIYEKYLSDFDAGCFLEETCLEKSLISSQQDLIRELLGEEKRFTSVRQGARFIQQRLGSKKALLVLDGVSHQEQLEWLAGDPKWFGKGSKIIVTARDKQLLISHVGDNVYEVQLLTEEESLELFSRHAFREKSPKEDFMELSREVLQYADGLPLALKVLGSSLHKRDKKQWRGIIDELKKIPPNDIVGKLRISFIGLDKDVREIFLDMACLYINDSKNYVELVLQSRGIQWIGIDYLVEKSLLSIGADSRFKMHNLIREMGKNVSREEHTNSRIWLNKEVDDLFAGKLETEKVESLWIQRSYGFKDVWIQQTYEFEDDPVKINKVLKRMTSLQVLRIEDGAFSSNCTVTHLPSSLRFVDWSEYPWSSLPENFKPSQLVVLILRRSLLVELFPIPKKLSNLKHLDLSRSLELTKTPNFGDNPKLETLILKECENLEEVHPSLGHCRMLKVLNLSCNLQSTKTPNFGDNPNLETLILWGCENLEEVHPSLGHCSMLKVLNLEGCTKLQKLPKFVSMLSLQILNLDKCTSLKKFPKISRSMQSLSTLYVGSPWIQSLPSNLGNLTDLVLCNCEVLESIPDTIVQNLKHLRIENCNKLAMLPPSLEVQSELERIYIIDCENLKKLPNSIQMESLGSLEIRGCPKLDTFPEINGDMQRLSNLILKSNGIKELPSSIGNLSGLTYLYLNGCKDLVSLPENIGDLQQLKVLNVQYCTSLSELPRELPPNIKKLFADDHLGLKSIRDLLVKCIKLEEISFSESKNVHWNFYHLLKFLGHFLRTFIQCHFHQRDCFHISCPIGGRIPESFGCHCSINLKPSWYTDNFKGFLICNLGKKRHKYAYSKLICQLSDQGRRHASSYSFESHDAPFLSISYIPYKSFWVASHFKERKNPNDYCLFEISTSWNATCWGVYLVYENKGEIGFSRAFVPLERSYVSNHLEAYDEHNTATDMVLHLGYEIKAELEVDQKEHETQNVELIRVCDGPSRKIGDASRKRKRSNKRKKMIKEAST